MSAATDHQTPPKRRSWLDQAPWWFSVPLTILLGAAIFMSARKTFDKLTSYKEDPPRDVPEPIVLRVSVFEVEPAKIKRFVWGFGTAVSKQEVVVSAEVAGRITATEDLDVGLTVNGPTITTEENGVSS